MTDNKNMKLDDEMMAKATGGVEDMPGPKYDIGDEVQLKFANEEGVVTTVTGTVVERRSTPGGWEYKISYTVNGKTYEHWYPEFGI